MSALRKCFFPSPKEKESTECVFKCLQYITSCRSHDSNLRHGPCPEILDSFITWQPEHIKDNQQDLSFFSTILPLHPSLHKALHAKSPSGSLSSTCTHKTPSSWKQFFVCCISLSWQFSEQSCTALVTHCPCSIPGPFLPTRTPLLFIWEVLTILMATITPLCQFYLKAAWIFHLNVQSPYGFQFSLIPQTPTVKAFIG